MHFVDIFFLNFGEWHFGWVGGLLGGCDYICFWVDDCLGIGPLLRVYPRSLRLVLNKLSSIKDTYVNEGGLYVVSGVFRRVLVSGVNV